MVGCQARRHQEATRLDLGRTHCEARFITKLDDIRRSIEGRISILVNKDAGQWVTSRWFENQTTSLRVCSV